MLVHGRLSSVAKFMDVIDPLTNPRAHGGNPADAFHPIIPSIPGQSRRCAQRCAGALRLWGPFRSLYVVGEDLGRAMLQATREDLRRRVIENAEIRQLAERLRA
jgi:hypothetical protein